MVDVEGFAERLKVWSAEFSGITGQAVDERLAAFLAKRVCEAGLIEFADMRDIVHKNGKPIRILGRERGRIKYEAAGHIGFGYLVAGDIDSADHPKLAQILDRLEGV